MRYIVDHPSGERWCVEDPGEWPVLASFEGDLPEFYEIVDGEVVPIIEAYRQQMWERVKATREQLEGGIAPTPIGAVQIDEKSKAKIMGALDFCRLREEQKIPFTMNFTLADNSRVVLDNMTVRQLAGAAGLYVSQIYDYSWTLRDAINAAQTLDDLSAIDIETGWP